MYKAILLFISLVCLSGCISYGNPVTTSPCVAGESVESQHNPCIRRPINIFPA